MRAVAAGCDPRDVQPGGTVVPSVVTTSPAAGWRPSRACHPPAAPWPGGGGRVPVRPL